MRDLRCTGENCTFSIKITSIHCYLLICCSLVFNQVTGTEFRGSANLATPKGMSITPISVNHGWHYIPMGSEVFVKYDLFGKKPMMPECLHHSQPTVVRQVLGFQQVNELNNCGTPFVFWTWLEKGGGLLASSTCWRDFRVTSGPGQGFYIITSESGLWLGADTTLERIAAFLSERWTYL